MIVLLQKSNIAERYQRLLARRNGGDAAAMAREDAKFTAAARNYTEPTPAQAEAGNYKKPRVKWQGLEIAIENPVGSTRRGKGWETEMQNAYGYICRSEGVDGDEVDCYLGDDLDAPNVYVVHQRKAGDWKAYDEDKVMIGFRSEAAAKAAYLKHYDDPRFLGPITAMPVDEFVKKVKATNEKPAMIKALIFVARRSAS